MKLALYLPNFRDEVTVKELEDLTALAEELDFDSVWTLDRIVVPEASDRAELQHPFGMMTELPKGMPVISRGKWFQGMPLIPWLAAKTKKVRIGMSIIDTPYRSPGVLAAELATKDHLSGGRLNVGVGSGWMPEEFAAASASHLFPRRHAHVRETIEIMQGIWSNELFEYHGEFADFTAAASATSRSRSRTRRSTSPGSRTRSVRPSASRSTACRAGSASRTPRRTSSAGRARWQRELGELGHALPDNFDMCSMIWFVITDEQIDQTPRRQGHEPAGRHRRADRPTSSSATRKPA